MDHQTGLGKGGDRNGGQQQPFEGGFPFRWLALLHPDGPHLNRFEILGQTGPFCGRGKGDRLEANLTGGGSGLTGWRGGHLNVDRASQIGGVQPFSQASTQGRK